MKIRTLETILIAIASVVLLFVDFIFFHDYFKPGNLTTLPEYLTGIASLLVFSVLGIKVLKQTY